MAVAQRCHSGSILLGGYRPFQGMFADRTCGWVRSICVRATGSWMAIGSQPGINAGSGCCVIRRRSPQERPTVTPPSEGSSLRAPRIYAGLTGGGESALLRGARLHPPERWHVAPGRCQLTISGKSREYSRLGLTGQVVKKPLTQYSLTDRWESDQFAEIFTIGSVLRLSR